MTEKLEGVLFPQTKSVYRCTNQACQDEKDKQTDKRLKLIKEKEASDQLREEKKLQLKKLKNAN